MMTRLPRLVVVGQPQHVIVRGNNRTEIFCAEEDYRFYLEKLKQACEQYQPVTSINDVGTNREAFRTHDDFKTYETPSGVRTLYLDANQIFG